MHYSTLIITAKKPTEEDIARILEPFDESLYYDKWKELKEKYREDEANKRVESPIFMWDWYSIGDRWDGVFKPKTIYGRNIVPIDDLSNFDIIFTHNCIDDVTEEVIVCKFFDGNQIVEVKDYDNRLLAIKECSKGKGYYATMVDIHD